MSSYAPISAPIQLRFALTLYKRLQTIRGNAQRPAAAAVAIEERLNSLEPRHVDRWMAWAVGCCPLLIIDAVQSMKGRAVPSEMSRQLRRRHVTAIIVQQRNVNSASSVTVLQFFSRMKRAIKGYDTAFHDTGPGR